VRPATATATAVTTLIGIGAVAVAAGRYASDAALKAAPGRPLPSDPRLTVHSTAAGQITLTRALASLRPGVYGIQGRGVHAVVGPVLGGVRHTADTVVRRLERVTYGKLSPGTRVRLTPQVYSGDPGTALGLGHREVEIAGDLGTLPAWFVPGERETWVITVHGLGTTREHPMNLMRFLSGWDLPLLDISYRGDHGAPGPQDGIGQLGAAEWRDLDAAIRYAVRYGAEYVILYGWSTGASMALYAAANSALRGRIRGLVLDSPVLDWEAALRALAAARHIPPPLLPLAVRAAMGRTGLYRNRVLQAAGPGNLQVPALIVHGPDDTIAPWGLSRELAGRRPELISLHTVQQAPHAAMWNADPTGYEESLRRFLTPLM
jgi:pimeloyl-ACP methyl ester carboxylesterase